MRSASIAAPSFRHCSTSGFIILRSAFFVKPDIPQVRTHDIAGDVLDLRVFEKARPKLLSLPDWLHPLSSIRGAGSGVSL